MISIAIALASWLVQVALAWRASGPSNAQPLPTPLGGPLGQDSTSQQRLPGPLSTHLATIFESQPQRHDSPSTGPPQSPTEVPGSQRSLNPTSQDARLRHSINLPLDIETSCQELDEVAKGIRNALASLRSPVTSDRH